MTKTDFLLTEYECCFEHLRYYDTRHTATLKYLISLASAVAAALFALYKYFAAPTAHYCSLQALLAAVVWVGSLLLYLSMVENRVYFIRIARQINMIREYFLKSDAAEYRPRNQLWRNPQMPMFRIGSLQTLQLMGAAFTSSVFFGLSLGSLLSANGMDNPLILGIAGAFVCFMCVFGGSAVYLRNRSNESVNKDSETGEVDIWPPKKPLQVTADDTPDG